VAAALTRGLIATQNGEPGNFWVDLARIVVRILLPLAIISRVMLLALGVVADFGGVQEISMLLIPLAFVRT
jgi:K+-transporting ATPase ATPase A chain